MSDQPLIDKHKEAFKTKSDSELISLYRQFQSHTEMSLAAQQLLHERKIEAERSREEREISRLKEIQNRLEELKKPHWTVIPIFVLALISAIAAVTGIFVTSNSKSQIVVPTNHELEKTTVTLAPKKPEPQQNILKPISSSDASRKQGSRH